MKVKILYVSFPRTGTVWTELVLKSYFDKTGFNYQWDGHHDVRGEFPMKALGDRLPVMIIDSFYHLILYKYRTDIKRVAFSNLERIISIPSNSRCNTKDIIKNVIEAYSAHSGKWGRISDDLNRAIKINHELMVERREEYLFQILKQMGGRNQNINTNAIHESFKETTKEVVAKEHKNRSDSNGVLNLYDKDGYEKRYDDFLDEYGDWIDSFMIDLFFGRNLYRPEAKSYF
jgi:hypothetical protein